MTNPQVLLLIGSSTARGFGIEKNATYFAIISKSFPSLNSIISTQDLINISDIVKKVYDFQGPRDKTILIIHSAADSFLRPKWSLRFLLGTNLKRRNLSQEINLYSFYKSMHSFKKLLLILLKFVEPNTGFFELIRSIKAIDNLGHSYRQIYVIIDTGFPRVSPEWLFRTIYSQITKFLLSKSNKIEIVDFKCLIKKASYDRTNLTQEDYWHLNKLGHKLLADELIYRINGVL